MSPSRPRIRGITAHRIRGVASGPSLAPAGAAVPCAGLARCTRRHLSPPWGTPPRPSAMTVARGHAPHQCFRRAPGVGAYRGWMEPAPNSTARARPRPRHTVLQVLIRVVPIVVVLQGSFEVFLRNDWFAAAPNTPGLVAGLLSFVPAGIWAAVDGYRWASTRYTVALWGVVAALVAVVNQVYGYLLGVWQYAPQMPLEQLAQMLAPTPLLMVMHAVPAVLLVLLGGGLSRLRSRPAAPGAEGSAEPAR